MKRGAGVATTILTVIAAVSGLSPRPGQRVDPKPASSFGGAQPQDEPAPATPPDLDRFLGPRVCEFFGKNDSGSAGVRDCLADPAQADFLIALIPDPESTHLALYADRAIESIMGAANDSDYLFQDYYLPWRQSPESELFTTRDRKSQQADTDARRKLPGVLFFRDKDHQIPSRVLFVLLVPEEPTLGANTEVLNAAVRFVRQTQGGTGETPAKLKRLSIIGPAFSGSIAGLAAYFTNNPWPAPVEIRSPSATDEKACAAAATEALTISCALHVDSKAIEAFYDFTRRTWWPLTSTSILAEDETLYGNFTMGSNIGATLYRYPREIARLRNVYDDQTQAKQPGDSPATPAANRFTLKGSYAADSPFVDPDSPAPFSDVQSPASQQAVLMSIGAALRRERTHFVGVTATDVLDAVFLSGFIRRGFPEIRVFTIESDLLFLRAAEAEPLTGMLAITDYPLFLRNQSWMSERPPGASKRRVQFASRDAESIYNVSVAFLSRFIRCPRTFPPSSFDAACPKSPVPSSCGPNLWLTTLGHDGYWPVALLDDPGGAAEHAALGPASGAPEPEEPSHLWVLLFITLLVASVAHCWFVLECLRGYTIPEKPKSLLPQVRSGAFRLFRDIFRAYPSRRPEMEERPFLFALTAADFCVVAMFTSVMFRFFSGETRVCWAIVRVSAGLVALCLLFAIGALLTPRFAPGSFAGIFRPARRKAAIGALWMDGYIIVVAWAAALAAVTVGIWMRTVWRRDYDTGLFAAYRSLDFANGVSPILPLLLLAFAICVWTWMQMKREGMMHRRQEVTQQRSSFPLPDDLKGFDSYASEVNEAIRDIFSARIWVPALIPFLIWSGMQRPWDTVRSLEPFSYDLMIVLSLLTVEWLTCLCWVQFMRIWSHFRKYLQALERSPFREAFSRLEKQISWVPLVTAPREHPFFISNRCVDLLKTVRAEGCGPAELDLLLGPAEKLLACMEPELAKGLEPDIATYRLLQLILAHCSERFHDELSQKFWPEGDSKTADKRRLLREEYLAFRHLIFMRYTFRHLRNLLGFIGGGFILSLIAVSVYPFQGQKWLAVTGIGAFIAFGIGVGMVFAQMDKDSLMSRITTTNAGELNSTFYFRLLRFGALPLITVMATQFPWASRLITSWLQPALEAIH